MYNRRTVNVITPAADTPVSLAEVKDFLHVSGSADDNLLSHFIEAATDAARQYMRRAIVTETLGLRMDGFPAIQSDAEIALGAGVHVVHYPSLVSGGGEVDLPLGPVVSVTSVTTYGRDNAATVFDAASYTLGQDRIYLDEGASWPTDLRRRDAVVIRYVSGNSVADVPSAIKHGIKVYIAAMYECREGCEMPPACKAILNPYRRMDDLGWF